MEGLVNHQELRAIIAKLETLEAPCPVCGGTGNEVDPGKSHRFVCPKCWGKKVVLTEAGEKLIEFIGRHLRLGDGP